MPSSLDPTVALATIAAQQGSPGVATSATAGAVLKNAEGELKTVVNVAQTQAGKL